MTAADRLAVIDVGSNSLRLFLCEGIGPDGPRGERETTVIGLRRGAAEDGTIAPDALERLDQTLAGYAESIDRFRPARTLPVATSATRDAPNRDAVASVVEGRLRAPMRILSGEEEAAVSFAGARLAVDGDGPVLVVDVGGGSTELVRGGPSGPEGAVSLQLGAVRQTERHLAHDPPRSEELAALRAEARALIGPGIAAVGGPAPVVGVAGTATSLAAIDIRAYDRDRVHRHRLTLETVDRIAAAPGRDDRRGAAFGPGPRPGARGGDRRRGADRGRGGAGGRRRRADDQRDRSARRRGPRRERLAGRLVTPVTSFP